MSRRDFLHVTVGFAAASASPVLGRADDLPRSQPPARTTKPPKKLAVVTTAYYYLSHAYHICGVVGYFDASRLPGK